MTARVPADQVEAIVGAERHQSAHIGRAVSAEERFYILHPVVCLDAYGDDLTKCPFSEALDTHGVDPTGWEDRATYLTTYQGNLMPQRTTTTLAAVLTFTSGSLVAIIDEAWPLQDFMTGRNLMTHQRAEDRFDIAPVLLEQFPALADVKPEAELGSYVEAMGWVRSVSESTGVPLAVEVYRSEAAR